MKEYEIMNVQALEILDSRGIPTLEVEILLKNGISGIASVPSGSATSQYEAHELRDGDKRHLGMGVEQAVTNVNTRIADKIIGMNVLDQVRIDSLLIQADGTENKSKYGANAILGVSLACARAAANALGIPLYRYIGGTNTRQMPVPLLTVVNGGEYTNNLIDLQEFMIAPVGAYNFSNAMEMACEVYQTLQALIRKNSVKTCVERVDDVEVKLSNSFEVIDVIVTAIEQAGYQPGHDIQIAINAAAAALYDENTERYHFKGESAVAGKEIVRNAEEMVQYYENLVERYPIYSIEDGLDQNDIKGWKLLTYRLGDKIQLVGGDLFVTNCMCLKNGIQEKIANAILIKYNQIGTLTETIDAIDMAKKAGYQTIISQRNGETEDSFISDLAVAVCAQQIKAGAPCRSDRTAKYNRLLRIEQEMGKISRYANIL